MDCEQIWREHSSEIYHYIFYRVHNRDEAEDIRQEVFIRLIRAAKRYEGRPISSIVALLKTISRNLIIDHWRKQQHTTKLIDVEPDEIELCEQLGVEEMVEQRDEVERALELLNQDQQQIIKYRLLDGFSIAETAHIMGKTISAVKTTQYRSVQHLRRTLKDSEGVADWKNGIVPLKNDSLDKRAKQAV